MTKVKAQAHQQAVLFLAALLAPRKELDYCGRSAVLAHARFLHLHHCQNIVETVKTAFRAAGMTNVPAVCLRPSSMEKAETRAARWSSYGVWTIEYRELKAARASSDDIPPVWFAFGKRSLVNHPTAGILNSRKSRYLSPRDPWITKTKAMVRSAIHLGFTVVSSYGTSAYAMVTALTKGSPLIVVCDHVLPFMDSAEALGRFTSRYSDLFDMDNTLFVSGFPPGTMPCRAVRYFQRDRHVAALSSMLMIAEVRAKGNMASVLDIAAQSGIPIRSSPLGVPSVDSQDERAVHAKNQSRQPNHSVGTLGSGSKGSSGTPRSEQADSVTDARLFVQRSARQLAEKSSYLVHYTRSCAGPWPGQTVAGYCQALIEEKPGAGHTGFDSLIRILEEDRIRGSRKLTRGDAEVICFTELLPAQLQDLNGWRSGLLRWCFEPYGIALRKDRLFDLGARPVIYAVEEFFRDLSDDLHYLFQLHGTRGNNWSSEREWRIKGDLALSSFASEEIFVIVPRPDEAQIVTKRFDLRVGLAGASFS